jgi:hypothetical protein
MIEPLVEAQ